MSCFCLKALFISALNPIRLALYNTQVELNKSFCELKRDSREPVDDTLVTNVFYSYCVLNSFVICLKVYLHE